LKTLCRERRLFSVSNVYLSQSLSYHGDSGVIKAVSDDGTRFRPR